jgi:hypothetical protein
MTPDTPELEPASSSYPQDDRAATPGAVGAVAPDLDPPASYDDPRLEADALYRMQGDEARGAGRAHRGFTGGRARFAAGGGPLPVPCPVPAM